MNPVHESLDLSPFQNREEPSKFISYRAQRDAESFFAQTCTFNHGLGMFYGPPLSGKMTVVRNFVARLPDDSPVAIIDGAQLDAPSFLLAISSSFGFELQGLSINVLLNLVKVFAVQQTAARQAPLLVIRNMDKMTPEAVHVICQLAKARMQSQSALRIILVSDSPLDRMITAPALAAIRSRLTGEHELGAMTRAETAYYLDAKLRHAGIRRPETVISPAAADEIYDASHGRPGLVDQCAIKKLSKPNKTPRLIITIAGETIDTIALNKRRILIGRSDSNDVVIDSNFISRHHAMLVRDQGMTVLADLNSTNGTFVNSKKIHVHSLRNDDIISLGDHGIKLFDPECRGDVGLDDALLTDTATFKTLEDIRRRIARENLRLSVASAGRKR